MTDVEHAQGPDDDARLAAEAAAAAAEAERRAAYERELQEVRARRRRACVRLGRLLTIFLVGSIIGGLVLATDIEALEEAAAAAAEDSAAPATRTTTRPARLVVDPAAPPGSPGPARPWDPEEHHVLGAGLCANLTADLAAAERTENASALALYAELFLFGDATAETDAGTGTDNCGAIDTERGVALARRAAALGSARANALLGFAISTGRAESVWAADRADATEAEREAARQAEAALFFAAAARDGDDVGLLAVASRAAQTGTRPEACVPLLAPLAALSEARTAAHRGFWPVPMPDRSSLAESVEWRGRAGARGAADAMSVRERVEYLHFLADTGEVDAAHQLGRLYLVGSYGLPRDYARALHYFRMREGDIASILGDDDDENDNDGISNNKNDDEHSVSDDGEVDSAGEPVPGDPTGVAYMLEHGLGVARDPQRAYEYYRRGAARGDPAAYTRLAMLHIEGQQGAAPGAMRLDRRDVELGAKYLREAAKAGWAPALYRLGALHERGGAEPAVPRSTAHALAYYEKALAYGNHAAGARIAVLAKEAADPCGAAADHVRYARNGGALAAVFDDADRLYAAGAPAKALARYELYAELGSTLARQNAAWLYAHEFARARGADAKLVRYTRESCSPLALRQGVAFLDIGRLRLDGAGMVALGDMYYRGSHGLPQDYARAMQCYLAVAGGNAQALFNIGFMHQWGVGTEQDLDTAAQYYERVAQSPHCALAAHAARAVLALQRTAARARASPDLALLAVVAVLCAVLVLIRFVYF